jgi:hypothetical protein
MQNDPASYSRWIALEAPLPEIVAEHRVVGGGVVVIRREHASQVSSYPERREEIRRDQMHPDAFG